MPLYPKHTYTAYVKDLLDFRVTPQTGDAYVDFTLPDLQGKMYTLSDQIRGKPALIDFWSTWCGPCLGATIGMIPVYEKYKDKGFTVVAIVQEDRNMELLRRTVNKHNFPWITLIDPGSKERTWKKYGVGDSGGALFLVDATGKIVFINPKPETVDKILADLFK